MAQATQTGLVGAKGETLYKSRTGNSQMILLHHYVFHTLPKVKKMLSGWEREAERCPDGQLRLQALSSLHNKRFHCQGGAVYASLYPEEETLLVRLIVAYQTLCDYLDNLCDRSQCKDGAAFRQLHQSLLDALTPDGPLGDYYRLYPCSDDGGYMEKLIFECRRCLSHLPSYSLVYEDLTALVKLYIDLQVFKHIGWEQREIRLTAWAKSHLTSYPDLLWQEFAAASGSTLALFSLFGLSTRRDIVRADSRAVVDTYFPWICGLHILLDYLIDQEEDRQGGDLNFTFYYRSREEMMERFEHFIRHAHYQASLLDNPAFEKTVIEGLLSLYLSDRKVKRQGFSALAGKLLDSSGSGAWRTYRLCKLVRTVL